MLLGNNIPLIIFISGVSGAGKTTLLKKICSQVPAESSICLHFDSIGVPSAQEMINKYGGPREWQKAMANCWVDKILTKYKDKKLIFLEGQVNLQFLEEACKKHNFTNYKTILIHCDDAIRHERLRINREQPELINQDMDKWAQFLKDQATAMNVPSLDSGKMTIDEMITWIIRSIDIGQSKSLSSSQQASFIKAQKTFSDFLNQSENNIFCEELTGGSQEGTIFKCTYQNDHYVIKFFFNTESGKNEIAWTRHASNLGIGCKFFYAAPDNSYMITAFAIGDSLVPQTANSLTILKGIALNLAKLHHSSAPFGHRSDIFSRIDAKYKKLQCSGKLKDMIECKWQHVKIMEAQIIKLEVLAAPCHNDLNWGNIFADNNLVTFIDWGDAALGNPYYDIAAFFVLNCIEAENEELFFRHYDAKLLNLQWQEYLQLLKQLVYFEFALNLLLGVQAGNKELLRAQEIPKVKHLNYYLNLLAKKEMKGDSQFLYVMAIASLNNMF